MSTSFKTPEEAAEAARLGFQPPKSPVVAAPPSTTKVVGYFNPNAWPISINISQLGISVMLNQSGDYVMMNTPKGLVKVNDPILEEYVRPNGLAREMADSPVPVIAFPRVMPRYGDPTTSVSSTDKFIKGPDGRMTATIKPMAQMSSELPPPGNSPVIGMTRAEAEAAGLIKPTAPVAPGVKDDGKPIDGAALPVIDFAKDLSPGQAKKLKQATQPPQMPAGTATLLSTEDAATRKALIESMEKAHTAPVEGDVMDLAAAETLPQAAVQNEQVTEQERAFPTPALPQPTGFDDESPVGEVEYRSVQAPPPPVVTPVAPQIVGAQDPNAGAAAKPNQAGMKFKCPACPDVGYPFRSGLERHVQQRHPEQVAAIMAMYPKK